MLRSTLAGKEFYRRIRDLILSELGDRAVALIVFGSSVYWRNARDVDLIVIIKEPLTPKEKAALEYKIASRAQKLKLPYLDVHVMSMHDFKDNLVPGTFLSGLALGYQVLLDRVNVEPLILSFLRKLSEDEYILYNRHGKWNLSKMAEILLRRKLRSTR